MIKSMEIEDVVLNDSDPNGRYYVIELRIEADDEQLHTMAVYDTETEDLMDYFILASLDENYDLMYMDMEDFYVYRIDSSTSTINRYNHLIPKDDIKKAIVEVLI